jgi:hypothetical protein
MNILFKANGISYRPRFVEKCVRNFGKSYNETVCTVINNSSDGLNKEIFRRNVAMLMPNFLMGRGQGLSKASDTWAAMLETLEDR